MTDFKEPDLKAPRYRAKVLDVINDEFFKEFKKQYPEYKHLSNKELKEKIALINGTIYKTAIEERDGVELPSGLGYIFIGSCPKKKSANTNYHLSKQYKKVVNHRNWESDQYTAKIFYTNYEQKYRFKFHELWGFKAVRQFKRSVSEAYPESWTKYIMVDNLTKVSNLFRRQSYKMIKQKEEQELLKQYDEFALE